MLSGNFAEMTTSTASRDLLHAANLRHETDGFTSPPKEGVLRIFFALKNPTVSAGFEPANLGTKGQHATVFVWFKKLCCKNPAVIHTAT